MVTPPVAVALVLLLAPACAPHRCGLELCDIRDEACQQRLAEATACAHESAVPQVPTRVISEAQYRQEARAAAAATIDPERFRRLVKGLALMNLVPGTLTVEGAADETAHAGAYYDPVKPEIVVIDRGQAMGSYEQVTTLVHELTHAIQHQRGVLFSADSTSTDQALARRAAIEGEAVLIQDFAELALFRDDIADVPWSRVFGEWQAWARQAMLEAPAPIYAADPTFAYPFGTQLAYQAWAQGGWPAVEGVVASPPASTARVAAGFGAAEPTSAGSEPLDRVALPELPQSFERLALDQLGAWIFDAYLSRLRVISHHERRKLSESLMGDRFSIHEDPQTGLTVVTWRLRFAHSYQSDALKESLAQALPPSTRAFWLGGDLVLAASNLEPWAAMVGELPWRAGPMQPMPTAGRAPGHPGCPARSIPQL
jgi:hypothetical protein